MDVGANNTFQPNLSKTTPTATPPAQTSDHTVTQDQSSSAITPKSMSIDTYKKVYKCNVDNLLKKYALGSQLTKISRESKIRLQEQQLLKENETPRMNQVQRPKQVVRRQMQPSCRSSSYNSNMSKENTTRKSSSHKSLVYKSTLKARKQLKS